jgi:alanyl-tRNA synthetase
VATNDLRDLALAVRQQPDVRAVVLAGETDTGGAALVAAVTTASGLVAGDLLRDAAKAVKGGGGGGKGDVAVAGGKDPSGVDEALAVARTAAGLR